LIFSCCFFIKKKAAKATTSTLSLLLSFQAKESRGSNNGSNFITFWHDPKSNKKVKAAQ
jgi:hypothetical protein